MKAQVEEKDGDYIVGVYCQLPGDNIPHWYRVMNFGERQGDAIAMELYDLPKMPNTRLAFMIRRYNPERRMKRVRPLIYTPCPREKEL